MRPLARLPAQLTHACFPYTTHACGPPLLCCRYLIPGGSAGHFKRDGYTFDVGSSMMFGFGDKVRGAVAVVPGPGPLSLSLLAALPLQHGVTSCCCAPRTFQCGGHTEQLQL